MKQESLIYSILFLFLFINTAFSQQHQADSLQLVLRNSDNDSTKTRVLLELADVFGLSDLEKAIYYCNEALKVEDDKHKNAIILDNIGLYQWKQGKYNEAINSFNTALPVFAEYNDSIWLGRVYNNIAVSNWGLGHSNEALEYYLKGLKIRRAIHDEKGVSRVLNNIGLIYQDWSLYEEAHIWHKEAMEISLQTGEINSISYSYSNVGKCFENQNELETALSYYQLAYKTILKDNKENRSISFFLTHLGGIYDKMEKLDSARFYYKNALVHAYRINNKNRISIAEYNLGNSFLKTNKVDSAEIHINLSYQLAIENKYTELIKDNQFALSKIAEKKGRTQEAFDLFKSATAFKDSTFNKEQIADFTDLQIRYFKEQEAQENILLRKDIKIHELTIQEQKITRAVLIAFSLLILGILILIAKSRASFKKSSFILKKSETKLQELNATKDKFFSIISHDLKSPFNGILGLTDILDSDFDNLPHEQSKEIIKHIKDLSGNAFELLEDLLQWARSQTGKMKYDFVNLDIKKVSLAVVHLLKVNASNKNIKLQHNIKTPLFAFADERALSTILRNLISNAIKFSNAGSSIIVEAEEGDQFISVSVTDKGIGISKEKIDTLFNLRVQNSTVGTNNEQGTGLGLILCKDLVEKQGGTIRVESELKKGSVFTFTLPKKA